MVCPVGCVAQLLQTYLKCATIISDKLMNQHWQEIADKMWTKSGVYCGLTDQYQDDNWRQPG